MEFTFQPYAPEGLGLFREQSRQVSSVCGPMGCGGGYTGLRGLGDAGGVAADPVSWVSAAISAVANATGAVANAFGMGAASANNRDAAIASANAQEQIAQLNAQSHAQTLQTITALVPWALGGLLIVAAVKVLK